MAESKDGTSLISLPRRTWAPRRLLLALFHLADSRNLLRDLRVADILDRANAAYCRVELLGNVDDRVADPAASHGRRFGGEVFALKTAAPGQGDRQVIRRSACGQASDPGHAD